MRRGDTTISRPREIRRPDQGFRIPRANFDDVRQKFRGENRERNLDGCVRRSRLRKPSRDGFHEG